jgi:hypothetical protein
MELSEKQLEVISRTVIDYLEQEKEKQEKEKFDRRLRNIRLLLKNYRSLVKHCEGVRIEIKKLDEKLALDLLDTDEFAIEAIKVSKKRTLATVKFVARMVSVYGKMCDEESEEAIRRYQTVYALYISEKRKTAKEIATCHKVEERTVYRDVNNSLEPLSVLMFGVDGLKLK